MNSTDSSTRTATGIAPQEIVINENDVGSISSSKSNVLVLRFNQANVSDPDDINVLGALLGGVFPKKETVGGTRLVVDFTNVSIRADDVLATLIGVYQKNVRVTLVGANKDIQESLRRLKFNTLFTQADSVEEAAKGAVRSY